MHEAGLAESIIASVRHLELDGRVIRVIVTGSHEHGESSREALAAHIEARLIGKGASVEVLQEPGTRLCSVCATTFEYRNEDDTCACGGQALPPSLDEEEVSVEVIDPNPIGEF